MTMRTLYAESLLGESIEPVRLTQGGTRFPAVAGTARASERGRLGVSQERRLKGKAPRNRRSDSLHCAPGEYPGRGNCGRVCTSVCNWRDARHRSQRNLFTERKKWLDPESNRRLQTGQCVFRNTL
jgi:hypothetical protein